MRRALIRIRPVLGVAALGLAMGWAAAFAPPLWSQEEEIDYTGHVHSWNDEFFFCHCGPENQDCVPCGDEVPDWMQ